MCDESEETVTTHHDPNGKDWAHVTELRRRQLPAGELEKFEGYMAEIFTALGLDLDTPATCETPRRHLQALIDATDGYEGDPKLVKAFQTECRGGADCLLSQVIEGPITFYSLCEHHALPFFGRAFVGYIAHEHILGLSKLARLVQLFARRFAVQERIGQQIANALDSILQPHGVAVYLEARHLCVEMRGVRQHGLLTHTTNFRGNYEKNAALRAEFLTACGLPGGSGTARA